MPRSSALTRQRILKAAYREFRRKGYSRVGVDQIAANAKLTKRTLYSHFKSKDALLAAVLEQQHELVLVGYDALNAHISADPDQIVEKIFADLERWASKPRWTGSGFTRVAMELADLPGHPARIITKRHKAALEAHLAGRLAERGLCDAPARAREIWILVEGAMTMILIHGDRSYARVAASAAKRLLVLPNRVGRK